MKKYLLLFLSVIFMIIFSVDVRASIIYDNGFRRINAIGASDYDFSNAWFLSGVQQGDDFLLRKKEKLTGFNWYGVYYDDSLNTNNTSPIMDNFTIRIFNFDDNDTPEVDPFFEIETSAVIRSFSGYTWNNNGQDPIYLYEYLVPETPLNPDRYFLSIVNDTSVVDATWWWKDSDSYNDNERTNYRRGIDSNVWSKGEGQHNEWAFYLTGKDSLARNVIPEPATMLLLGSGLMGAVVRRRKKF